MTLIIEPGLASTNYWRDIWRYRELIYFLVWRDILVRYKQTAIGVAWAVLRPALTMLVFVAFRRLVGINPGELPEPDPRVCRCPPLAVFLHRAHGILRQSDRKRQPDLQSLFSARDHSRCCGHDGPCGFSDWSGPARSAHAVVRRRPGWQLLTLPLFVLLVFGLSLGLGLFLAALNVEYRDFRYIVPFIVQFGLFISPIAYTTADIPERWRTLTRSTPWWASSTVSGGRILDGDLPLDLEAVGLAVAVTGSSLLLGVWYFRRMERSFADVI